MLTPVDIQNKVFKGGIGYDKKEVETFMSELASDYGELYRSSVELKDKVATLDESLQHYRSIEESMQKALTLSEKTAEETVNAANDKARQINTEAEKKAEAMLADAKAELQETKEEIYRLQQQHATFKEQFSKILDAQLKLMDGEVIDIDLGDFEPSHSHDSGFGNFSGGGFGGEGGLGGLGGGGGYTGSSTEGRERTNQEPAFDRGSSLNMDPFGDAMNGGGRFSKQTGGAYNNNSSNNKKTASNNASKSTLNVKDAKSGSSKVKKNFAETSNKQPTASATNVGATNQNVQPKPAPQTATPPTPKPAPQPATPPTPKPVPTPKAVNPAESQSQSAGQTQQAGSIKLNVQTEQPKAAPKVNVAPAPQENIVKPQPAPVPPKAAPEEERVTGEVESRVNEANMIDSEDNYSDGFDFVSDGDAATTAETQSSSSFFDEDTVTGEVEDRINEANMIDSEDNYNDGFDFVSEGEPLGADTGFASSAQTFGDDEDTYSGEVEDRVNEATMIDSEDNYNDGFDFVVGNENEQEEIPTILPNLNIDPFANVSSNTNNTDDDDVLVGDVEDNLNQSNLIGNSDDEEEGFNFL